MLYSSRDLILLDDVLPNPDWIRQKGIAANYTNHAGHDGETYKRVARVHLPEVEDALTEVMGRPIVLHGMAFRLNYEGELPNNEIHADLGWGTYAAVLYLSEPPEGQQSGTAFWKHRLTSMERIIPGDMDTYEAVKGDWNNVAAWEQTMFVSSKYNSMAIYRSELFHSRWPFEAYGNSPEDGRLIVVVFFS